MLEEHQIHGDHWACLTDDVPALLESWIPRVVEYGDMVEGERDTYLEPGEAAGLAWPDIGLCALAIVAGTADEDREGSDLVSAYPYVRGGIRHAIVIDDIIPWENGYEGWITGHLPGTDGPSITFFDTGFYAGRDIYEVGDTVEFEFAAVAYRADVGPPPPITVDDPGRVRELRAAMGAEDDGSPLELSFDGASILYPREEMGPDSYEFIGTADAVEAVDVEELRLTETTDATVWQLAVTVLRLPLGGDEAEESAADYLFDVLVFVADGRWAEETRPQPGDDTNGILWLIGRRAEVAPA